MSRKNMLIITHLNSFHVILSMYYLDPISDQLIVKNATVGLACVSLLKGIYRRVYIKGNKTSKFIILYVDLGLIEEVSMAEIQFKYLLNYFAQFPCMIIPSRLLNVELKLEDHQAYQELCRLCQLGPFTIEPQGQINGTLNIIIIDINHQCFNDFLVNKGLAVLLSK